MTEQELVSLMGYMAMTAALAQKYPGLTTLLGLMLSIVGAVMRWLQ